MKKHKWTRMGETNEVDIHGSTVKRVSARDVIIIIPRHQIS